MRRLTITTVLICLAAAAGPTWAATPVDVITEAVELLTDGLDTRKDEFVEDKMRCMRLLTVFFYPGSIGSLQPAQCLASTGGQRRMNRKVVSLMRSTHLWSIVMLTEFSSLILTESRFCHFVAHANERRRSRPTSAWMIPPRFQCTTRWSIVKTSGGCSM